MALFRKADPYHDDHGRFDFSPSGPQNQPTGRPRGRPAGGGDGPHKYYSTGGRIDSAVNTPDAQRTLFRASGGIAGGVAGDALARLAGNRFSAAAGGVLGGIAGGALGSFAGPGGAYVGEQAGQIIGSNALPAVSSLVGDYVGTKIGGALWALKNQVTSARMAEQSINTRAHVSNLQAGTQFTPRDIAGEIGAHAGGWGLSGVANAALHFVPGGEALGPLARTAIDEVPGLAGDVGGYHAGIAHYDAVHGGHAGPRGGGSASHASVKKLFGPPASGGGADAGGGMQKPAEQPAGAGGVSGLPGDGGGSGGSAPPIMPGDPEPPKVPRLFQHPLANAHPGFDGSVGSLKHTAPPVLFGRKQWGEVKGTPFGHYLQQKIDDVADALDEAQEQQVMGPHLFGKNFGFRVRDDMNAQLVNSGEGVPANIRFLRRLQDMDAKAKRQQLRRLTDGVRTENLQPRPNEDDRQYRQRVKLLFQQQSDSPEVHTVKVRARKANSGATQNSSESAFRIEAKIAKELNPDDQLKQGLVFGWASVIEKDGVPVVDHQGDRISADELAKAAHDFMKRRNGGVMHDETGHQIGHIVESTVLTHDLQKALGIDLGKVGWLVGMQVVDPRVKVMAQKRLLKAFSIGGRGRRKRANA